MIGETVVGWIANNILALLPFRVIRSYQRGVRFRLGRALAELAPGWHWFLPILESIEIVDVAADVINLPTQSVTTKDGRAISFSANIEYEIASAVDMYCNVQHLHTSLAGTAMGHLAVRVRGQTWESLVNDPGDLERSLRGTLGTRTKAWGVKIVDVRLTDIVATKALRLYGDSAPMFGL